MKILHFLIAALAAVTPTILAQEPAPAKKPGLEWYEQVDHGPAFVQTWADWYRGEPRSGAAKKGLLLFPAGDRSVVALFDTETLKLVTASSGGIALDNTPWKARHGQENKILNETDFIFNTGRSPGWATKDGKFFDTRAIKEYGSLPFTKFHGYYIHGKDVVVSYRVYDAEILESVTMEGDTLVRTLEIAPHKQRLRMHMANTEGGWTVTEGETIASANEAHSSGKTLITVDTGNSTLQKGFTSTSLLATIPPSSEKHSVVFTYSLGGQPADREKFAARNLSALTKGGPDNSPHTFEVQAAIAADDAPWVVDTIPLPPTLADSPYKSDVRIGDFDFFSDGDRAALSTWGGDVWIVSGLKEMKTCTWKRFATGTFEPLGLKIVDDVIHLNARDGIYQLIDQDGNGECDFYKVFNYDVLITANFHEFSFGLETDENGNFYFSKASPVKRGGRGFDRILPHNGVVIRVPKDGKGHSVIATGLRAPGGIGVGPQGQVTTGENEGTWQPACKINYFTPSIDDVFLGTEDAAHHLAGRKLHMPLMYLPMSWDNSGGSQIFVPEGVNFGIPAGTLLHLSYGQSSIYQTYVQEIGGKKQAAAVRLPVQLGSSAQRAAFGPRNHLWVSGFRGWQTNAANQSAFQRIRYTGVPTPLPTDVTVTKTGIKLSFAQELDPELANDPTSFAVEKWDYVRSEQYGSGHFSIDRDDSEARRAARKAESKKHREHDQVEVTKAELQEDGKTILLTLATHTKADQLLINYDLETTSGTELIGKTVQSIFYLP